MVIIIVLNNLNMQLNVSDDNFVHYFYSLYYNDFIIFHCTQHI